MRKSEIQAQNPNDWATGLINGAAIFNSVFPLIKEGFIKLSELIREVSKGKLGTAAGKRQAIEELIEQVMVLQGQNKLQKKWNAALIAKLAEHNIEIDEVGED